MLRYNVTSFAVTLDVAYSLIFLKTQLLQHVTLFAGHSLAISTLLVER